MSIPDDHGALGDGGGFDGGSHDAPLVHPLEAAWVDANLRNPSGTTEQLQRQRIRRNDPCPCGSGRKFKRCCIATLPSRRSRHLRFIASAMALLVALLCMAALVVKLWS